MYYIQKELGYANLGAMLMRAGIAYDSDEGRAICGAITAIVTGRSYATSAEMASKLSAPRAVWLMVPAGPIVDRVIEANPGQVAEFRAGKDKLLGFFVGQVMKETGGKANPGQVNQILKDKLK